MTPIHYTRDRSAAISVATTWGLLFALEATALGLLALVIVPTILLKLAVVSVLVAGPIWVLVGVILAPLRTHHLLTSDTLDIRYGRDRLAIPRDRVVGIESVHEHLSPTYSPGFVLDKHRGRVTAALSHGGQLLIRLDPPLDSVGKHASFPIREVLINADNPAILMEAFAHRTPDAAPSTHDRHPATAIKEPRLLSPPAQHAKAAIETIALSKHYGPSVIVDKLSLVVRAGEIYGLLGPNGAGKSTTIGMLVGLMAPTSGVISLGGHDLALDPLSTKTILGYVPDRPVLYDTLTGREFLSYVAQLRALPLAESGARIEWLLDLLDLNRAADHLCRTYSFGMRSKLSLAAALIHEPAILILDEPFNGLDPQSSRDVQSLLVYLAENGTAILLCTHDLAIAEKVCHRVGILIAGKLVTEGALADFTRSGTVSLDEAYRARTGSHRQRAAGVAP